MLGQSPIGINLNSPVTWFVIAIGIVVLALTVTTRRGNTRPRSGLGGSVVSPPAGVRARYADEWSAAQALFVENPHAGCRAAQAIVASVLRGRGFPLTPELLDRRYRAGCRIVAKADGSTDELRRAFVDFRAAFDALVAEESELIDP